MTLVSKRSNKEFAFYKTDAPSRYKRQAAHDIRSPLSVINLLTETYKHLVPNEATELMRTAVQRINDIANEMLEKEQQSLNESLTTECLKQLVEEILNEKKVLNPNVQFIVKYNTLISSSFTVQVHKSHFQRALSNIINNALESTDVVSPLIITIELKTNKEFVEVICTDNGKGIPEEILERVGEAGFSHGKENTQSGSGLGVHQARTAIESIGGHFEISSVVNKGTCVSLLILR